MTGMEIVSIHAFDDNYIWLLRQAGKNTVAVVDPGDEVPVLELLSREQLQLGAVLLTHKHGDHTGGVPELAAAFPGLQVFGPGRERIASVTRPVADGDRIFVPGLEVELSVLELPGHTEGSVAYLGEGALFCGDTLFTAGCGRVFSGTHEQLYRSLRRIAALPADTRIYCGHEYTLDNIGFAKWVEPDNPALLVREREVQRQRALGKPSVPSMLEEELETNPFLRTEETAVIQAAERFAGRALNSGAEVFAAIRNWKDREYD
jgi:hydroxyacylglutathione hydrolase